MIVRRGIDIPRLARHLGPSLIVLLAYDIVVTILVVVVGWERLAIDALPLPLLGSAIALVVTLRNNAAYGRWWEARTLWGAVVNGSRSFARGLLAVSDSPELQRNLVRRQIAFALSLRCHLLRLPLWESARDYLPPDFEARHQSTNNVPVAIQTAIAHELASARQRGIIDIIGVARLEHTLGELANAQGGLERIKNTPVPRQYNQLPQVFTSVYCLLLPLGLVHDLGYMTPVGSTLIGFMFLSLDQIGRDLEDPFNNTIHDIPMLAITRTIEIDLLQMIDGTPVPPAIREENGVLW